MKVSLEDSSLSSCPRQYDRWWIALSLILVLAPAVDSVGASCFSAPPGVVGWWAGDGNANDLTGANNGTLQGGATASAVGLIGSAFSFNGTSSYVQIPDSAALRPTNLTVEAWVLFSSLDSTGSGNSPAGQQYIVFKQNTRSSYFEGYDLGKTRTANGDLLEFIVSSAQGQLVELLSTTHVATGIWYHVAGVRGPTVAQLYVNGQLENQTNVTFAQNYGDYPLYFGTSGETYWDHKLNGLLDEVSLYNRALSSNEIAAIYTAGAAGKCKVPSVASQPQSQAVLVGNSALFTVSATGFGSLSYQWRFNGANIAGATATNLTLASVQSPNAGSYTVVVTNLLGSATSAVAVLSVLVPPVITAQPQSLVVTNGNPARFSAAAEGATPLHYQWRRNGVDVSGATDTAFNIEAASTNDAAGYVVAVTNVAGAVTSSVATLTVYVPPWFSLQPQDLLVTNGNPASFSISATGTPPLHYQWRKNGADLSGATDASLLIAAATTNDAAGYSVVVTNVAGAVTSSVATLTVYVAPWFTVQPANQAVRLGSNVVIPAGAQGVPPPALQWFFGANPLAGETSTSLTLTNIQSSRAGAYYCVASNAAGTATSQVAMLAISSPPIITTQPESRTNIAGTIAAFSAQASGTEPLSYRWQFDGFDMPGATGTTLLLTNVQPGDGGAYKFIASNALGAVTSEVATLTVLLQAPCVPVAAGLVGWWPGEGNASDIAGTANGLLQVGANASAVGMVGSAFSFDGTNGYVQIPDSPVLRPTNLTIEAWVRFASLDSEGSGGAPAGDQYLVFKQNTDSANFEGFALTKTRAHNRDLFDFQVSSASGQSAELTSASVIATGVWYHVAAVRGPDYLQLYVNGTLEGETNVSFPQDYGSFPLCFGSSGQPGWDRKFAGLLDEVSLYDRALSAAEIAAIYAAGADGKCKGVTVTAQPQDRTVIVGGNVSLTVAATGSAPLTYQWQRDGTNLVNGGAVSGAYSPTLTLANVAFNDSASYQVVVANVVGGATSTVALVEVVAAPTPPTITAQPVGQVSPAGTNVLFTVGASGSIPLSYQWLFNGVALAGGGQFSGATSSALAINYVLPVNSGGYSVVVTNFAGAVTSAVATLTVNPPKSCLPAPEGLVGWWPGDGSARDIIGNNNGTLMGNAVANAQGFIGQAFSFDGTNDYVQIPDSPVFHLTNLTVECWVRFTTYQTPGNTYYSNQQYIVFKQNSQAGEFEGFALTKDHDPQGDVFLWEVASSSGELIRIDSVSTVVTGVWYHVVGVRGPDYVQLYKDGQLEVQTNVDFPQDYGTFPLYFGTSGQSYYDRRLHGELDEVSLYNRALSAEEIAALYAAGAAGKCKGTNGINILAQPKSQMVPPGTNVLLTVAADGLAPLSYQWQFNSAVIPGATNTELALANVQPVNAGDYQVLVSNPAGSVISDPAAVTVTGSPMLLNARMTTNGTFVFTLTSATGLVYMIEASTDLRAWTDAGSVTNLTGLADFTDPASSNSLPRFYRARLLY